MTRRELLAGAAAAMAPVGLDDERIVLSAPLTHSDWLLQEGIPAGDAGVRHMLEACKACGWSRIYWRCIDSGRSCYRSKLLDPMGGPTGPNIFAPTTPEEARWTQGMSAEAREALLGKMRTRFIYATFESLESAVRIGHELGLQIHAWMSINEDDHGWGWQSRFTQAHPQCRWRRRDGTAYHSQLSFAYPEVRRYKLSLIREVLAGYRVDGLFLDWIRTGDVRDNPQTDPDGVANYGYEEPLVRGFKAKHGVDPHDVPNGDERWVRFRAEPHTRFMRDARKLVRRLAPGKPLAVMVSHPWAYRGFGDRKDGSLRGLLLDVKTWAREGLIDEAVAEGYYTAGGTPEKAFEALKAETEGRVRLWFYGWVPSSVEGFEADRALAMRLGASQVLFWEADYIDQRANKAELQAAMRARAKAP